MITLSQLRSRVETAPLSDDVRAPKWRILRENGGEIVARAEFSGNYFLEVFETGYVYYRADRRWTTFSLQDTTLSFEIERQDDYYREIIKREVLESSIYDDMPWFVRVLFEGEIRINTNRYKEEERHIASDITFDELGLFGYISENPLTIVLDRERDYMWRKSLKMTTEIQQLVITECLLNDRMRKEVAEAIGITPQSVSDAIKKGRRNLRKIFDEIYGEEE